MATIHWPQSLWQLASALLTPCFFFFSPSDQFPLCLARLSLNIFRQWLLAASPTFSSFFFNTHQGVFPLFSSSEETHRLKGDNLPMQPASQVDRQRYRVGLAIISASWKSDKGSVQCCRTLSFITAPLFIEVIQHVIFLLHISRWVWSYSQVSAFHWQQDHSHLFLSCPQLPRCHVKIKPCAAFDARPTSLCPLRRGWGFFERRGSHYFYRTVVVARKQTFADAPLIYNRIELNWIE